MKKKILFAMLMAFFANGSMLFAQDEESSKINTSADIFNRYVWRGVDYGSSPNIQPTLEWVHKSGFTVGYWGAFSTNGQYNEIDLYVSYSLGSLDITFTDYFFPVSGVPASRFERYLNFENQTTGHGAEFSLLWNGTEKFPLQLLVGSFIWGADKNSTGDQNYSTYIEAQYTLNTKAGEFDAIIGFTPFEGLYGNTMGVINLGLSRSAEIKITEKFSLPVQSSVIVNPQTSNIYLLFGITL